tara:strand:+ start:296 stop:625 length:330 start_codon:yes stop_codon:yes gene_type:complete
MAQPGFIAVVPYSSTTPAAAPLAADMQVSELAVNSADRKLYTKGPSGAVVTIGNGATGAGGDQIFVENGQAVTASYTLPVGYNAMSTGPLAINSGVTVTIPSGSVWAII